MSIRISIQNGHLPEFFRPANCKSRKSCSRWVPEYMRRRSPRTDPTLLSSIVLRVLGDAPSSVAIAALFPVRSSRIRSSGWLCQLWQARLLRASQCLPACTVRACRGTEDPLVRQLGTLLGSVDGWLIAATLLDPRGKAGTSSRLRV